MFAGSRLFVPHNQASRPWWIAARPAGCDGRAPPVRPCSLGSVCEGGLRQGSIFEITSTPRTGPRGSGAYATQPSCDLHTSAAAWLWLSPQHSSSSPIAAARVLPRLSESHASVPSFFHFLFSHTSFCYRMEYQGLFHFPWKKVHVLSHVKLSLEQKRHRVIFLLACSLSPHSFLFSLF